MEIQPVILSTKQSDYSSSLSQAGQRIREGGLVSFPTETVYGLGANALNPEAVKSIFAAKERPLSDPIIVHISKQEEAKPLVSISGEIEQCFDILSSKFWPGPITFVMRANDEVISEYLTASTGFVGI